MGTFLISSDLPSGTGAALGLTVDQMIGDAEGLAMLAAPCLGDEPSPGVATVSIASGVLTVSTPTTLAVGDEVWLGTMTGGAPLVAGVTYYVASALSSTTLTLAATLGGAAIVTTTDGSSTFIKRGTPLTAGQTRAVKAILRGAIMRWNDAGSGARQSVTTGPFSESIDTTVSRRGMFWPSEIASLQSICSDGESGKAFSVDTVSFSGVHAAACSINFGAAYCSCGADIAGYPLWGV